MFDFFDHSSGLFFSVDSYSDIGGRMGYDDIPTYTATKRLIERVEITGEFDLSDCLDLRLTCENITGSSTTLADIDTITGSSFDFFHRQFDGAGGSTVDTHIKIRHIRNTRL